MQVCSLIVLNAVITHCYLHVEGRHRDGDVDGRVPAIFLQVEPHSCYALII